MARKEGSSNRRIKSERVGEVTLFLSPPQPLLANVLERIGE